MRLKCRINGKDYDIVQGCTFTDNFNETLDSGTICIDQVYKINNIAQYDDVFIWNADENFDGYGNIGDIFSFEYNVEKSSTGGGSSTTITSLTGAIVTNNGGFFTLSGIMCRIWSYYFYDFTSATASSCRYRNINVYFTLNISKNGGNFISYNNFKLKAANNASHGTYDSSIVLSNETLSFSCTFNSNTKTFIINSNQVIGNDVYNISHIAYQSIDLPLIDLIGSYYVQTNLNKQFEINVTIDDFTRKGINSFIVRFFKTGISYDYNLINVANVNDLTTNVTIREPKTNNRMIFVFTRQDATTNYWTCHLENNTSLSLDFTGFFSTVDDLQIIEFTGVQDGFKNKPSFYKHLLVDQCHEEEVGLETGLYKYTIDLFSETKKLEKIPLPNISITQSLLIEEKRSCWFYMEKYVNLFSPKYKKVMNSENKRWAYVNKYSISESGMDHNGIITNLKDIFDKTICPEMSLTNPSLKDLLSRIMVVKDMIPIVIDDVIYGYDIGNKTGLFDRKAGSIYSATNFTTSSISSSDFATDARREYSGALSQENSARLVEYLGFRSPNSPFLTLEDMVLETRFPIYKINSIKMCYYKKAFLSGGYDSNGNVLPSTTKIFLCKQDITPLVVQNVVRNTLSTNWQSYRNGSQPSANIHDFSDINYSAVLSEPDPLLYAAQFKICTVGYDIGNNRIIGWGEIYEHLDILWFKSECSYIENIVNLVDHINLYGDLSKFEIKDGIGYTNITIQPGVGSIIDFNGTGGGSSSYLNLDNIATKIKSIVFEVDYDAMYNGAILHAKDNVEKDDIVTVDNCSSALTVLESDGLFEREKMNRLGNPIKKFISRYDENNGGSNPNRVQNVGTYDEETDTIIYSRQYSVYDNVVLANYEATYEYVLKNYFTSVWAKYRTYSLMSYGESIRRAENIRKFLILSKDTIYYENQNQEDDLLFEDVATSKFFLSFLTPTKINETTQSIVHDEKLNCGYFLIYSNDSSSVQYFLSDINAFASGTSICFNISTYDNISGGNYIDNLSQTFNAKTSITDNIFDRSYGALNYKTTQKWWSMVETASDAYIENIGFYVCNLDNSLFFKDYLLEDDNSLVENVARKYMDLPKIDTANVPEFNSRIKNKIGVEKKQICKDNKEIIDMTMQFSYIAYKNNDILFSPWICKLNDLIGFYNKFDEDQRIITDIQSSQNFTVFGYDKEEYYRQYYFGYIVLKIDRTTFNNLAQNVSYMVNNLVLTPLSFQYDHSEGTSSTVFNVYKGAGTGSFYINSIKKVVDNNTDLIIDYTFVGTYKSETYLQILFTIWNKKTFDGVDMKSGSIRVRQTTISGDNDNYYFYLVGDTLSIPTEAYYNEYYSTGKNGAGDDYSQLNNNNSLVDTGQILDENTAKTIYSKNMFVVASANKINNNLEFNYYKYIDSSHSDFGSDMYVDEETSITTVFSVFENENGFVGVSVNPKNYENNPNINFAVKSLQYYYRDSNNIMHFVFGVNLTEITEDNISYESFNIYLSAISKRSMDVYDENHNVIGRVANALENQNIGFEQQIYTELEITPPSYQEAQYLESDGREILNLGAIFDVSDPAPRLSIFNYEFDFSISDKQNNSGYLFGSYTADGFAIQAGYNSNDGAFIKTIFYDSYSTPVESNTVILSPNRKYHARIYYNSLYIDDILVGELSGNIGNESNRNAFALFGCKTRFGYLDSKFIGTLYNFKVYMGATLQNNLVPRIRISDGEFGMYDIKTNTFYTNQGTGKFKIKV